MKKILTVSIHPLIAFTFCFILLCQYPAMAQTENEENRTGALPNQMFDTRSLSMGSATISDLYGIPSIGINPALSGLFNSPNVIQFNSNHNWDTNLMQHDLTLPTLSKGLHHVTLRFGFLHRMFKNLPFTSSSSMAEPDLMMFRAELAYAVAFSNHFSLGTLMSSTYTTTDEGSIQWNHFANVGLVYAPDGAVSYGMVFRGLGNETTYEINESGQTTLDGSLATQSFVASTTVRFPIEERTYLSISFANEKRFGEDGLWYKGGFEVTPISYIDIRGGVKVNFEQSDFEARIGLGVNTSRFQIDYMIVPESSVGEQFHQIGITFQF